MTLKAAVIYDDFDFAARAAALLERVAVRTDEAMQWNVKPWRLDLLRSSSLADAALDEAADADLIIVALWRTHFLPDELREWLERWAAERQIEDAALMALCPEKIAGPRSLGARLKEFAEWRGLPFLGCLDLPEDEDSIHFIHRRWQGKQPVIPAAQWSADQPPTTRHWGINE